MTKRIDRVEAREKLALRRDPYWHRVSQGRYIGFRKMTKGTSGTWLARAYDGSRYVYETLGDFATVVEKERYDAARKAAEAWFQHLDLGGSSQPFTVKAACESYIDKIKSEKSERAAHDAEGYLKRLGVLPTPDETGLDDIATVLLSRLNKTHMAGFRKRAVRRYPDRSSFNRAITPLRASLNLAHEDGKVGTDQAWLKALKPFPEVALGQQKERRRTLYIDRDQRRQLLEHATDEARPFLKSLAILPLRPGEVAQPKVEHFNYRERSLTLVGKTGKRVVPLSAEAVSHFKECAKDKLPSAWLVSRANGSQWKKEAWRDEVKDAAKAAKLPKATVAYTLRHSVITDLVVGGLDIFTVAKLAGTSVAIIEKHYGHLRGEHAREALEKLALG